MVINVGSEGISLREIIEKLGGKSYKFIECRCKWTDEKSKEHDDFFGCCSYDSKNKVLSSLDGDSYSLDNKYAEYEEWTDNREHFVDKGELVLTVWEKEMLEER